MAEEEVQTEATEEAAPVEEAAPAAEEKVEAPAAAEAEVEVPAKFKSIVEDIEKMTVLELSELVKVFEKKFGVQVIYDDSGGVDPYPRIRASRGAPGFDVAAELVVATSILGAKEKLLEPVTEKEVPNLKHVWKRSRELIRNVEMFDDRGRPKFKALLTTFELMLQDVDELSGIRWSSLAVDEAHRLKNDMSQLHVTLSSLQTAHRLLVTGTPLQVTLRAVAPCADCRTR